MFADVGFVLCADCRETHSYGQSARMQVVLDWVAVARFVKRNVEYSSLVVLSYRRPLYFATVRLFSE